MLFAIGFQKENSCSQTPCRFAMNTTEVIVKNQRYSFSCHVTGVQSLLHGIRNSPSGNPEALPLRGAKNERPPAWASDPISRGFNQTHCSKLRKMFLEELNLSISSGLNGLYFFLKQLPNAPQYYYIGKSNNLARRIGTEHLKNKDFIFYSICYPQNREYYLDEVLKFYGSKRKYAKFKGEYIRESACLTRVSFDTIAWVGCNEWPMTTWEGTETHFIASEVYKPCCNVSEKNATPPEQFRQEFNAVEAVLNRLLDNKKTNST